MIRVLVDNRIRIPLEDLDQGTADGIRAAFTHRRPDYGKRPGVPEYDCTWDESGGCLTVPRGGMPRVRQIVGSFSRELQTFDRRAAGEPMRLPHARELWPHQVRIVEAIERRQNCLIRAGTGGAARAGRRRPVIQGPES